MKELEIKYQLFKTRIFVLALELIVWDVLISLIFNDFIAFGLILLGMIFLTFFGTRVTSSFFLRQGKVRIEADKLSLVLENGKVKEFPVSRIWDINRIYSCSVQFKMHILRVVIDTDSRFTLVFEDITKENREFYEDVINQMMEVTVKDNHKISFHTLREQ